jgi:nickel-dependent lactate racemase
MAQMWWKAWYGPERLEMSFPADWDVRVYPMRDAPRLTDAAIAEAIRMPVGTAPLRELARGRKNAVIASDDISRPAESARIIPCLAEELNAAGIPDERILILVALGGHRQMHRPDLLLKFGSDVLDRFRIYNHSPFYNLVPAGTSQRGTPIEINRFYAEADLKIGVGSIVTHPQAGFGGGGKIVLPGLASTETIFKNHCPTLAGDGGCLLEVDGNENRADIEDVALRTGLDFIVNQVSNDAGEAAGIFAGHPIEAHRAGVRYAREVYATPRPELPLDVAVVNAFPMDTDIIQIEKALNVFRPGLEGLVPPGGSIVIVANCPEGRGFHHFGDYLMPLWQTIEKNAHTNDVIGGRQLLVFSPNLHQWDVDDFYPAGTTHCATWEDVVDALCVRSEAPRRVGIFPAGVLQIIE